MIEDLLCDRAKTLRAYFESPIPGEHLGIYKRFPRGSCKISAMFFLKWIGEKDGITSGFGIANAQRLSGEIMQSHAWAEVDGYIVDITADQFSDFDSPIFVGKTSSWHETFCGMTRHSAASFTSLDGKHLQEYKTLLEHIGGLSH